VTISPAERGEAKRRVLERLSELFWDNTGYEMFDLGDLTDAAPLRTTLAELEDEGIIE
jgi:hypothetical protein